MKPNYIVFVFSGDEIIETRGFRGQCEAFRFAISIRDGDNRKSWQLCDYQYALEPTPDGIFEGLAIIIAQSPNWSAS